MFQSKQSNTTSVSEEDQKLVKEFSWMIRPCALYINEYSDCTSIKGRFDQYYTYGKLSDCSRWDKDRFDCRKFTKEDDIAAGVRVIKNEKQRIAERIQSFKDNDIMIERKRRPPANWSKPLPHHIVEKHKDSYLADHVEELMQPYDTPQSSCVIS